MGRLSLRLEVAAGIGVSFDLARLVFMLTSVVRSPYASWRGTTSGWTDSMPSNSVVPASSSSSFMHVVLFYDLLSRPLCIYSMEISSPSPRSLQLAPQYTVAVDQEARAAEDDVVAEVLLDVLHDSGVFSTGLEPDGGDAKSLGLLQDPEGNLGDRARTEG